MRALFLFLSLFFVLTKADSRDIQPSGATHFSQSHYFPKAQQAQLKVDHTLIFDEVDAEVETHFDTADVTDAPLASADFSSVLWYIGLLSLITFPSVKAISTFRPTPSSTPIYLSQRVLRI